MVQAVLDNYDQRSAAYKLPLYVIAYCNMPNCYYGIATTTTN